ncbi:MAG: tRNA pseudouridine(38-40) synthase TruA [Candidatus Neomarinimicrobiota bacterium]
MPRFKIIIQYDGVKFFGWQLQKQTRTVQGELEQALKTINGGQAIRVHGAGRTDTGVHALGQTAHFDLDSNLSAVELKKALNGNLGRDVEILDCQKAADDFHARYSARKRNYYYLCRTDNFLLDRSFIWKTGPLNSGLLNKAARMLLGVHDFTSFSRVNHDLESSVCSIYESAWKTTGPIVNYRVSANRFLHHMVRYLVGTMVEISKGRFDLAEFENLLDNPKVDAKIYKAPACGLVLENVEYD